jgi:hypothetical protein
LRSIDVKSVELSTKEIATEKRGWMTHTRNLLKLGSLTANSFLRASKKEKEQKSTNKKIFRPRLFEDMKNEMANHGSVYIWLSRLVNESASQSIITELFYVGIGRLLWCFCGVG